MRRRASAVYLPYADWPKEDRKRWEEAFRSGIGTAGMGEAQRHASTEPLGFTRTPTLGGAVERGCG
jgi:hypothetical protein